MKSLFSLKAFAITALLACASVSSLASDMDSQISVTGQSARQISPSYAILNLGVYHTDKSVNVAKQQNDQVMSKLISELHKLGIQKNNIQTSNITIDPNYDYSNSTSRINGYNVNNTVTVKVTNMDTIGKAIDAAIASGATNVNSLSFQSDIPQSINDQLTTEALMDAKHQAEVIAHAFGKTVGPVKTVSIGNTRTESLDAAPRYMLLASKAANLSTSTPVEDGDLIASKTANVTFYLQ